METKNLADPGDVAVGPDQHRRGRRDHPDQRQLPRTGGRRGHGSNAIRPRAAFEVATWYREVEQHRPGVVQQVEDPRRPVGGDEVEIRHPAAEQRVSVAEVVAHVQARHDRRVVPAWFVHREQLGDDLGDGGGTVVPASEGDLRKRVA